MMLHCSIDDYNSTNIPTKVINSILINYNNKLENVKVPLATFESPLWYSVKRGALVSNLSGGIFSYVTQAKMSRSIVLKCSSVSDCIELEQKLKANINTIKHIVKCSSNYAEFEDIFCKIVGQLLYVNIRINPAEAAGHNMVTKAAQEICNWILSQNQCQCVSVSGNFCVDKKVSAINPILGRGHNVHSEIVITRDICRKILKTTPEAISELNVAKNLIGSTIAGSLCSANAHYANMLLAVYLATGQDAANIVEGSQGITTADIINDKLYFSVNLPNIIVGSIGNGKINTTLKLMNCCGNGAASRLAAIIGATVLCGELSLMSALTNNGELIHSHLAIERK